MKWRKCVFEMKWKAIWTSTHSHKYTEHRAEDGMQSEAAENKSGSSAKRNRK